MAAPNILCDTAGMTNAQWLAARMHGPSGKIPYTVGGSDVAAVFGVSPWTTPLELWMIKKGRMKPPAKGNANQLEMGHLLEPIAAHWYAKKTGNRVYEDTNLYQHADHPYALANFDRRFERASDGEPGILECTRAVPIIKQASGTTVPFPCTMNCSCVSTWPLLMSTLVRSPQSGETTRTTTWRFRISPGIKPRKI